MKILVIADIHGKFQILEKIINKAEKENPDLVICPGNITDMFDVVQEFSQLDVADIIIQKLLSLRKPLLCVPGNHDPYDILDVFDDYKINLHGKRKKIMEINFMGFGGALTPFNTLFEPSEEETKETLERLAVEATTILVVHNPPKNTKTDKLKSGEHVGSTAVREFIHTHKPLLTITAHIHEAFGEDKLGSTTLFNPGPAFQGRYGLVEITKNKIVCKNLKV